MARKKSIKKFIEEIAKDTPSVRPRPITLSKKDMPKKHTKSKPQKRKSIETGFICDDFEILI